MKPWRYEDDCNLMNVFDVGMERICTGSKRFLVIDAEYDDIDGDGRYSLRELNKDYPVNLIQEHVGSVDIYEKMK